MYCCKALTASKVVKFCSRITSDMVRDKGCMPDKNKKNLKWRKREIAAKRQFVDSMTVVNLQGRNQDACMFCDKDNEKQQTKNQR